MVNKYFNLNLPVKSVKAFKKNNNLSSGLDGRFKPGHIPPNKGKKGVGGWEPTQFKKGNRPANWMPIGTERLNPDGYLDIKVRDGQLQNNWRQKHILVWEKANGPLPKGHAIIFGDGDRMNTNLENLILVTRRQLLEMNIYKLIKNDSELTRSGVIIADIQIKLNEMKRAGGCN